MEANINQAISTYSVNFATSSTELNDGKNRNFHVAPSAVTVWVTAGALQKTVTAVTNCHAKVPPYPKTNGKQAGTLKIVTEDVLPVAS